MKRKFLLLYVISTMVCAFALKAQITIVEYYRPSGINGLTYQAFEVTPSLRFDNSPSGKDMILSMKVRPATAQNGVARFDFSYRYNGTVYTDKMIGADAFYPINAYEVTFDVEINHGAESHKTVYSKVVGAKVVAKVAKDAKASDYTIHITRVRDINYSGTATINRKISDLIAANKKKEQDEAKAKADAKAKDEKMVNEVTKSNSATEKSGRTASNSNATTDDFWSDRPKQTKSASPPQPRQKTDAEIISETRNTLQQNTDNYWKQVDETNKRVERESALASQSFYAAQRKENASSALKRATTLNAEDFSTIEEMEAAFEQQRRDIDYQVREKTEAENQRLQADANYLWRNSSASDKAIGNLAASAGALINNIGEEKRRKEEQKKLEKARDEARAKMEADIAAERRKLMLQLRNKFIAQFTDGGVPLSSHKVEANELYFFSYVFDKNTINNEAPLIYLTNVFPIGRYGDGTWPFKSNIVSEIKQKSGPGTITLMGYYGSNQLATENRDAFFSMAGKCGFVIKDVTHKGKKASAAGSNSDDFWETGNNKPKADTIKRAVKKDDFWNN